MFQKEHFATPPSLLLFRDKYETNIFVTSKQTRRVVKFGTDLCDRYRCKKGRKGTREDASIVQLTEETCELVNMCSFREKRRALCVDVPSRILQEERRCVEADSEWHPI